MQRPSLRRFLWWFAPMLGAGATVAWMAAGSRAEPPARGATSSDAAVASGKERHPIMRREIAELTGARAKVVWVRDLSGGKDPFTRGRKLLLLGVDTADPRGVREFGGKRRNYARPLISPDGETVVYSDEFAGGKGSKDPKKKKPAIFRIDWATGAETKLRDGFAVDLWEDPADGAVWVVALEKLNRSDGPNRNGSGVVRFRLDDPEREESVPGTDTVSADNLQFNRDGTAASLLAPWPNAGRIDLEDGKFTMFTRGCWPSISPDNSGLGWVFDGEHENLRMFLPGRSGSWRVNLSRVEGVDGREVYHPRWSNHPKFLTFTGPFTGRVRNGGRDVGVLLGKFNADFTALEATVRIRNKDKTADFYPDLWVEGGDGVSLDVATLGPADLREAVPETVEEWSADPDGLLFVWEHAQAPNAVASRTCSVEARRFARFDPQLAMKTDGGWFEADAGSSDAVRDGLAGGPWSVEFAATPPDEPASGVVLSAGSELSVLQAGEDLVIRRRGKSWLVARAVAGDPPVHVSIGAASADAPPDVRIDGEPREPAEAGDPVAARPDAADGPLTFGALAGGAQPWGGTIEAVAIHAGPPDAGTAAAHAALWERRSATRRAPERTVVRAELVEASPVLSPADIAPYLRSWTTATYRRLETISGADPGESFTVAHWTVLDRQFVPGALPAPGEARTLTLEDIAAHPELESERGSDEVSSDSVPYFFDAATPGTTGAE